MEPKLYQIQGIDESWTKKPDWDIYFKKYTQNLIWIKVLLDDGWYEKPKIFFDPNNLPNGKEYLYTKTELKENGKIIVPESFEDNKNIWVGSKEKTEENFESTNCGRIWITYKDKNTEARFWSDPIPVIPAVC